VIGRLFIANILARASTVTSWTADYAFAQELFFLIKAPSSSSLDVADLSSSPIELKVQRTSESARGFHRQAVAQSEYGFESFYVPMLVT